LTGFESASHTVRTGARPGNAKLRLAVFAVALCVAAVLGRAAQAPQAAPAAHAAPTACARRLASATSLTRLRDAMSHGRFIAYQPTSQQLINGQLTQADPDSIRADLTVLRPRFDSLITYGSINGA
jgi:hypothetical protein